MDPACQWIGQARQRLGIGRAQFRQLAIGQDLPGDGMKVREFLQYLHPGGVTRLRLLLRRQSELIEEHELELLRGADVELHAGQLVDLLLERLRLLVQPGRQRAG